MSCNAQGKLKSRKANVITSLELDPAKMEENNLRFQAKYRKIEENEVRYEEFHCDDAEYLLVAFGSSARICQKVVEIARAEGIKLGLLRPITLWPFPKKPLPIMPKGKRHAFRRTECRPDGGRYPPGCKRKSKG